MLQIKSGPGPIGRFFQKLKKKPDTCAGSTCLEKPSFSTEKKKKTAQPKPSGGIHMNMRELGAEPGDVRPQKQNSNSEITVTQEQRSRGSETETAKMKANIAASKKSVKMFVKKKKTNG